MDGMAMDAPAMMTMALIGLVAGAALGTAHLASLWWSVVLMRDGRPILGFIAQALRFCALVLALAFIARHGAAPLLSAAFGVLASRALLLKRFERIA
jgi:F1F0 ATPase subunit 2